MKKIKKLTKFEEAAINRLKKIPRGRVTTYRELARVLGRPRAARAVGNAMSKNPWAPRVPCHRVVRSDGQLGGYGGGPALKKRLLKKEGVIIKNGRIVRFREISYRF